MVEFVQHIITGVLVGSVYAMITAGFIVIYRGSRVFNIAQGELVMVGGFLIWSLAQTALPTWVAVPLALGSLAILGLLLERLVFRPLIGQQLFAMVMVTVALMLFLRGAAVIAWGPHLRSFPVVFPYDAIWIGPFVFNQSLAWGALLSVAVVVGMWWMFRGTTLGLTMSGVAEDHQVARSLGISVKRSIALAWMIGCIISGLAAAILFSGRTISFVTGEIGLAALPCALLAGLESVPGALLAGLLVGLGSSLCEGYLDPLTAGGTSTVFPFVMIVIVLIFLPNGLFGWKTIERL